jgi:hypothetical protein
VLKKLGPSSDISQAVIDAYQALYDSQETLEIARDDAETDTRTIEVRLDRKGRDLWRKLVKWYGVARETVSEDKQYLLDRIRTGDSYTLPRLENRARQTGGALAGLPDGFTAADVTKAELQADITAILNDFQALEDSKTVLHEAQTNLDNGDAALDAENKRLYGILDALYDVPGTVEYDEVHSIPTETDDTADDEDEEEPKLPPEK